MNVQQESPAGGFASDKHVLMSVQKETHVGDCAAGYVRVRMYCMTHAGMCVHHDVDEWTHNRRIVWVSVQQDVHVNGCTA